MTVREAILKVLEEQKEPMTSRSIHDEIMKNQFYESEEHRDIVSADLSSFIKQNDARVKRVKKVGKYFLYYLAKFEDELNLTETIKTIPRKNHSKSETYKERDLHKLLSSYLKNKNIYSRTIFHEKSTKDDKNQKWTHPDMIGIKFLNLNNKFSQALLKVVNNADAFDLISYEIKREINSDHHLKESYFQAVSNSSWANYGYLVAFDINANSLLKDEMERLNQSFGIGIIELKANPYESKVLFPAKHKELDFKTIDKLQNNPDFAEFIEYTEKLLTAGERYKEDTEKAFEDCCDSYFETNSDSEIEKYCKEKNIPFENENEE